MPLLHMAANAEPQAQTSQSLRWISCAPTPRFLSRLLLALAAAALVLGVLGPAPSIAFGATSHRHKSRHSHALAKKGKQSRHAVRVAARSKAKPEVRTPAVGSVLNSSKVAVFAFDGDDYAEPVRAEVVRLLEAKGIKVETTLRAPDTPEQFREMAAALNLAVYVHGRILDSGPSSAVATVTIRNGVSGRRIATARFNGQRRQLPAVVEQDLWRKVGPAFSRVCVAARKTGKRHYRTMRIEAGTPIEDTPRPLAGP